MYFLGIQSVRRWWRLVSVRSQSRVLARCGLGQAFTRSSVHQLMHNLIQLTQVQSRLLDKLSWKVPLIHRGFEGDSAKASQKLVFQVRSGLARHRLSMGRQ